MEADRLVARAWMETSLRCIYAFVSLIEHDNIRCMHKKLKQFLCNCDVRMVVVLLYERVLVVKQRVLGYWWCSRECCDTGSVVESIVVLVM